MKINEIVNEGKIGAAIGGALGGITGAAGGAVAGSMVAPGVGTAVGGLGGAAAGGAFGAQMGDEAGESIAALWNQATKMFGNNVNKAKQWVAKQLRSKAESPEQLKEQLDELREYSMDDLRADAEASLKKNIDKQSDTRMANMRAGRGAEDNGPGGVMGFMKNVGDKQIGMVKGAYRGLTGQL
jgi:hypothetical protein